ncbi:unnamed protein product [Ectocarpus sp. 12 AP-2014]
MSNPYVGYQGFRSAGQVLAPSLKPGETYESRDNKYSRMGKGVAYENGVAPAPPTITTCSGEAFSNVSRGDYQVPDRRGVSAKHFSAEPQDRSKPFLHDSLYEHDFRNFSDEVDGLDGGEGPKGGERDVENAFKREFDRLDAGNGVVHIRDMPKLIQGVLGRDVRPWILDRILKMFEAKRDGKVTWLDFQDGLRKVAESARSDASYKEREMPEWLVANRKVMPAVTHGQLTESCYQMDMGKDGEIPRDRRIWYKTGMSSTTLDLFGGTTKATYQVPGYGGFIPASKMNLRAREHGDMKNSRRPRLDLRLFYRHNNPGYTGHAPAAACNDPGPSRCGSDPLTTSGAAALGLIL